MFGCWVRGTRSQQGTITEEGHELKRSRNIDSQSALDEAKYMLQDSRDAVHACVEALHAIAMLAEAARQSSPGRRVGRRGTLPWHRLRQGHTCAPSARVPSRPRALADGRTADTGSTKNATGASKARA